MGAGRKQKRNRRAKKITMIYLITKVLVAMLSFSWLIDGIYKEMIFINLAYYDHIIINERQPSSFTTHSSTVLK